MTATTIKIGAVAGAEAVTVVMTVGTVTRIRMETAGGAVTVQTASAALAGTETIGMTRHERPHHSTEKILRKTVMPHTLLLLTTNSS